MPRPHHPVKIFDRRMYKFGRPTGGVSNDLVRAIAIRETVLISPPSLRREPSLTHEPPLTHLHGSPNGRPRPVVIETWIRIRRRRLSHRAGKYLALSLRHRAKRRRGIRHHLSGLHPADLPSVPVRGADDRPLQQEESGGRDQVHQSRHPVDARRWAVRAHGHRDPELLRRDCRMGLRIHLQKRR